jgi:hypothetical protein
VYVEYKKTPVSYKLNFKKSFQIETKQIQESSSSSSSSS